MIIADMKLAFTKMQGAGNDFVVLDQTRQALDLSRAQLRWLADRHFGVGADQILSVLPSPAPGVDFAYRIHNADGGEVEHCGNGARCFLAFVRNKGLSTKERVRVQTMNRLLELQWLPSAEGTGAGQVRVDMQAPAFGLADLPFDPQGLQPEVVGHATPPWQRWVLPCPQVAEFATLSGAGRGRHVGVPVVLVSMGNPHAVVLVDDTAATDVNRWGPWVQQQPQFVQGVNVGFLQVQGPSQARLRVYERGSGETLACGTGACAAAVAGMRLGLLDSQATMHTLGGPLTIEWAGLGPQGAHPVLMTGPATHVFDADIDVPDLR
jgi:diaminopimelate epimerase